MKDAKNAKSIEYTIIKSARHSIGIYIKNGKATVRAPKNASKAAIDSFVQSKASWIAKHCQSQQNTLEERNAFSVNYGDTAMLLGKNHPILPTSGKVGFDGKNFYVPQNLETAEIKQLLTLTYREVATTVLVNRTLQLSKIMGVKTSAIKINSANTRWGSCSSKNSINYSWRLILADPQTVDYVIIHELAHTIHHNHSDKFWSVVQKYIPRWQEYRKRLKTLQEKLQKEGW